MKRWFDFRAQARGAEIVIYDEIGAFGVPAKAFLAELKALGPVAELTRHNPLDRYGRGRLHHGVGWESP